MAVCACGVRPCYTPGVAVHRGSQVCWERDELSAPPSKLQSTMFARPEEVEEMDEGAKMRAGLIPYKQVASLEDHLVTAAQKGDVEAIRRLVAEGANVNCTDCLHKTPMHFAAVHGQPEALQALKELGGDPNMKAMGGKRPVDWARVTNRGTPRKDAAGSLALLESWAAEDAAKAAAAAS